MLRKADSIIWTILHVGRIHGYLRISQFVPVHPLSHSHTSGPVHCPCSHPPEQIAETITFEIIIMITNSVLLLSHFFTLVEVSVFLGKRNTIEDLHVYI